MLFATDILASGDPSRRCAERVYDEYTLLSKRQIERMKSKGFDPETATELERLREVHVVLAALLSSMDIKRYQICPCLVLEKTTDLLEEASVYKASIERFLALHQRTDSGEQVPEDMLTSANDAMKQEAERFQKNLNSFLWQLDFMHLVYNRRDEKARQNQ